MHRDAVAGNKTRVGYGKWVREAEKNKNIIDLHVTEINTGYRWRVFNIRYNIQCSSCRTGGYVIKLL